MDFVTQDSIPDTDYVIVVRTGTTEHCFALETLSQWFVESTLTWNVLPRHPYVGTQVPAAVYREVVEQARMFVPHFAFSLQSSVASLPAGRRSFVTTGSTMSASSALADDAFSADEIFDMIDWSQQGGSDSPPPPSPSSSPIAKQVPSSPSLQTKETADSSARFVRPGPKKRRERDMVALLTQSDRVLDF